MGRAVLRVLQEPSFRDKAVQMGVALTRCGGPVRAAGLIDELVNRRLRTNAL
jgi:UDP:flavonoid glycosyltransferase YjiC (YdhE family)